MAEDVEARISAATAAQLDWIYHLMKMTGRDASVATTAANWEDGRSQSMGFEPPQGAPLGSSALASQRQTSETMTGLLKPFRCQAESKNSLIDTTVHDFEENTILHSSSWLAGHAESCIRVSPMSSRGHSSESDNQAQHWQRICHTYLLGMEQNGRAAINAEEERDRSASLEMGFTKTAIMVLGQLTVGLLEENRQLRREMKRVRKAQTPAH
eukprot:GILI01032246.1.p1 GENE.GILI01032246.1~~GILI01032246.1.p1  ORF type:complete len:212 (-),score=11.62 GILI01032246.1:89-724(-)